MKIIDYLGEDEKGNRKVVVLLPPKKEYDWNPTTKRISVAHDYVRFYGTMVVPQQEKPDKTYPTIGDVGVNNLSFESNVTIGIRDMIEIVLPYLNEHQYLQKDHIKDRIHLEDDKYFERYGLTKPRWKKGDACYAYDSSGAIELWDKALGESYVLFRRAGEKIIDKLSKSIYDKCKSTLQLSKTKWELIKDNL